MGGITVAPAAPVNGAKPLIVRPRHANQGAIALTDHKTCLIAGCGYLGRRAAAHWLAAGCSVSAITRSADRAEEFRDQGIEPVVTDLSDPTSTTSLPPADIVLWAVGFDRSASSREAIWLDGLRRFVDALPAPPQRFLYVSSTSVYGDQEGDAITESTAPAPATEGGRCCWQAETLLRERLAPHPQTHVTVLRMAGIYGPDRLLRRVDDLRNQQPLPGSAEQWLNLIHVDDGVRAIDWAATTADPPSLVNVVNAGTLTREAYYALLAELADAPPPVFGGPASGRPRGGNKRVASEWAGQIPFAFDAVAAGLRDAWSRSAVQ